MPGTYTLQITGLNELVKKLDNATKNEVVSNALTFGALSLTAWIKDKRLSGPRPTYLGVKTGRLRSSISAGQVEHSGNEYLVKIGTNVVYASIHEFGGMAGRNNKVRIPARPFLRPSIEDSDNQQKVLNILTQSINEALAK